jgi:hypothetical protein
LVSTADEGRVAEANAARCPGECDSETEVSEEFSRTAGDCANEGAEPRPVVDWSRVKRPLLNMEHLFKINNIKVASQHTCFNPLIAKRVPHIDYGLFLNNLKNSEAENRGKLGIIRRILTTNF